MSYVLGNSFTMQSTTHYVQPTELDLESAEAWTFHIPGDLTHGLSFPENYQLSMEVEISVKLQEYSSSTYDVPKGEVITTPLKRVDHGLEIPSSTGALIFFKGVETYFKNMSYSQNADMLYSQSVNWLNKICSLEHSFIPDSEKVREKASLGFQSGFHTPPNLTENTESGKTLVRAAIPLYPFRNYAPFSKSKPAGTHLIPPNLNLCVKLIKEDIPLMSVLSLIGGQDVKVKAARNKETDSDIKRIASAVKEAGKIVAKYYCIEDVSWKAENVYLLYNKVKLPSKIPRDFNQTFSSYRIIVCGLNTNSFQELFLNWDIMKTPKTLILYFLRDHELQFKKTYNTTICPAYSFRPENLQSLVLKKSSPSGPVPILELSGLASRDPNPSWYAYLQYLKEKNFTTGFVDFWRLPSKIPCSEVDRGFFNAFAVDLSDLQPKEFLQVSLEFTGPAASNWSLGCAFLHDVSAKFPLNTQGNGRRFEFQYI